MATLSIPNSFTNDTNADALQVNANFAAVATFANTEAVQRDASIAFTAVPSGPATDPTTSNQLTRKSYVDAKVAAFVPAALSVTLAMHAADSVDSSKIVNASITGTDIAATTITGSNIAVGTVTSSNILDATIVGGDIAASTVTPANTTFGGAWVSTGLTYSNITGGTGTCYVMAMGKTLFFRVEITAGTATATGLGTFNITGYTPKTATQPFMATGYLGAQGVKANASAAGFTWGQDAFGANFPGGNSVVGVFSGVVEVN